MAKPDFIAEVGNYDGTPDSLEAVIRKLHPSVQVSLFSVGTRYFVKDRQGLGYVMINVALFHGNSTGNGESEPESAINHHCSNVRISVSSPEVDCQQYIDRIVKDAHITLLSEHGKSSLKLDGTDGTRL
ncbi:hypothetical protein HYV83_04150 [Candidatus Woesearchaeota archaeon]|nr:hypothetical protein [Candidatus Woesearchaeota archaeon]